MKLDIKGVPDPISRLRTLLHWFLRPRSLRSLIVAELLLQREFERQGSPSWEIPFNSGHCPFFPPGQDGSGNLWIVLSMIQLQRIREEASVSLGLLPSLLVTIISNPSLFLLLAVTEGFAASWAAGVEIERIRRLESLLDEALRLHDGFALTVEMHPCKPGFIANQGRYVAGIAGLEVTVGVDGATTCRHEFERLLRLGGELKDWLAGLIASAKNLDSLGAVVDSGNPTSDCD